MSNEQISLKFALFFSFPSTNKLSYFIQITKISFINNQLIRIFTYSVVKW